MLLVVRRLLILGVNSDGFDGSRPLTAICWIVAVFTTIDLTFASSSDGSKPFTAPDPMNFDLEEDSDQF